MLLSAIHIPKHNFFNDEPITINFGGFFFYSIDVENNITRKKNENYIKNFFSSKNIELVTAIVGKNGIGKTTVLETIIEVLKHDQHFKYGSLIIYENDEHTFLNKNHHSPLYKCENFDESIYKEEKRIIFYSPFIDFKPQQYGYIDLKLDNIIHDDFKINSDLEGDLYSINPILSHQYANDLRYIEFQESEFSKLVEEKFNIPKPNGYIISFNDFKLSYSGKKINFHNTPLNYRKVIQDLWNAIEDESREIVELSIPQVQIQLKLMKNYFIRYILQQLIKKMEERNHYLSIGNPLILPKKLNDNNNIQETLFWFLDNHKVQHKNNKTSQPLPIKETKDLILFFEEVIGTLSPKNEEDLTQFNWDKKTIIIKKNQAIELLKLQKKYIVKLSNYFGGERNIDFDSFAFKSSRIHNLMNFEYSLLKLSSGEISLLNLFSRFYSFFEKNFSDFKLNPLNGNGFIILIDEGDSGFHPEWKKKYINIILLFFEAFFEKLNSTIQIIFTTHDPLTLSDIPNYNIVYLSEKGGKKVILTEIEKPQRSFGANINDLLSDSFFIEDGLIGDFAKSKINEVITWLNFVIDSSEIDKSNKEFTEKANFHGKVIEIIDEPFIKNKLRERFVEATNNESFIDKEILRLQNLKKNI